MGTMDRHQVLVALGPGGTTELAERVLVLLESQSLAVPELGGLAEVCAELGKSRQVVGHWVAGRRTPLPGAVRRPFPEPIKHLAATTLWDLAEVRRWGVAVGILDLAESSVEDP